MSDKVSDKAEYDKAKEKIKLLIIAGTTK